MATTYLRVVSMPLSDGSMVYDLHMVRHGATQVYPCITEKDAFALATKIEAALLEHTNEEVSQRTDSQPNAGPWRPRRGTDYDKPRKRNRPFMDAGDLID